MIHHNSSPSLNGYVEVLGIIVVIRDNVRLGHK